MASRPKHAPEACARSMRPKHAHTTTLCPLAYKRAAWVWLCAGRLLPSFLLPRLTISAGVILFDFRLLHRGMPNVGGERAVAHAVLSTGFAKDPLDFPSDSVLELVDALPNDPDESREVLRAVREQQREAWAAVRESSYR